MEDPELPTPFEKALTKMLGTHKPESCLSAEELIELAEHGRHCPGYEARISHVATCAGCFDLFRDLRRMEQARALANGEPSGPARRRSLRRMLFLLAALALAGTCGLALLRMMHHEKPETAMTNRTASPKN